MGDIPNKATHLNLIKKHLITYYPKLQMSDLQKLVDATLQVILVSSHNFGFSLDTLMIKQLYENNGQDIKAIANLLLPHMENRDKLIQFSQLMKTPHTSNKFANVCIDKDFDFDKNLDLLLITIRRCKMRLMVNFRNIFPISPAESLSYNHMITNADIYDVMINDFYHNALLDKWFIYQQIDGNTLGDIYWVYAQSMMADLCSSEENPQEKWINIVNNINTHNDVYQDVFKNLIVFFELQASELIKTIKPPYIRIWEKDIDIYDDDKMQETVGDLDIYKVIETARLIPGNLIRMHYIMIRDRFMGSLYFHLHEEMKTNNNLTKFAHNNKYLEDDNKNNMLVNDCPLILKNIYHIGKSLAHFKKENNKIQEYSRTYVFLNDDAKTRVNAILDGNPPKNWYNITGFLKKYIGFPDNYHNYTQNQHMENIQKTCFRNNAYFLKNLSVFALACRGTLTKFIPRDGIKPSYNKAIYFMTRRPFNETKTQLDVKKWCDRYANNWIQQINFFHHYTYNRIMMVTGGTGVGKSTEVPKLTLYAEIILMHRFHTAIAITMPRISPARGIPGYVSNEMGVSLEETWIPTDDKDAFEDPNKRRHHQFQYQYEGKEVISNKRPFMRFMTDGLIWESMHSNVHMRTTSARYNTPTRYLKYNVILVDEAHEHNINMDLILTVLKYSLRINWGLRLIIISATMDDDEPRYRWFYNMNHELQLSYIKNANAVDRRIHIAKPNASTNYHIKETYSATYIKTYAKAEEKAIQECINLCSVTSKGEILIFSIGEKPITKIINHLVGKLPPNVIVLPFMGKYPETYKSIFDGNLGGRLDKFIYKREHIFDILKTENWDTPGLGYPKTVIPYTRAVVVATNIAEASITIDTLKWVIDTGFANTTKYHLDTLHDSLEVEAISEQSRLQRKGRVGRVSSGSVIYTYVKDGRKNIPPKYNISSQDVTDSLMKMLSMNTPITFSGDDKNDKRTSETILEPIKLKDLEEHEMKYLHEYNLMPFAVDGFTKEQLIMINFFIVNPDEVSIIRNYHKPNKVSLKVSRVKLIFDQLEKINVINSTCIEKITHLHTQLAKIIKVFTRGKWGALDTTSLLFANYISSGVLVKVINHLLYKLDPLLVDARQPNNLKNMDKNALENAPLILEEYIKNKQYVKARELVTNAMVSCTLKSIPIEIRNNAALYCVYYSMSNRVLHLKGDAYGPIGKSQKFTSNINANHILPLSIRGNTIEYGLVIPSMFLN
uniref:RNA helicase n=1 Tax=Megaviridae environmental sample TaxID=1737588 RepID=A0A5J6VIX4_9VIRU|nr:MAG: hypothetical protein [Megaviridae environmental sample]